jgi:hypothetical protein
MAEREEADATEALALSEVKDGVQFLNLSGSALESLPRGSSMQWRWAGEQSGAC